MWTSIDFCGPKKDTDRILSTEKLVYEFALHKPNCLYSTYVLSKAGKQMLWTSSLISLCFNFLYSSCDKNSVGKKSIKYILVTQLLWKWSTHYRPVHVLKHKIIKIQGSLCFKSYCYYVHIKLWSRNRKSEFNLISGLQTPLKRMLHKTHVLFAGDNNTKINKSSGRKGKKSITDIQQS